MRCAMDRPHKRPLRLGEILFDEVEVNDRREYDRERIKARTGADALEQFWTE
jgi:hypothetical protein